MKCPVYTSRLMNLLVVGACFVLGVQPAVAGEALDPGTGVSTPAPTSSDSISSSAPSGASGMRIHIDPQTGQLTREGPAAVPPQLSPREENSFSTSHQGLVETLSPVPGGGVIVNLQGRFQSPLSATVDPTGKVTIEHLHPTPSPDYTK
jgi:hypothetical protein